MAVNALYLDNWDVEKVVESKEAYRLLARYEIEPTSCPKCGVTDRAYRHGPKTIDYVDAPVHGKKTVVQVDVQRYRCKHCGGTFMQPLPDMDPARRMTRRCADHIREQGLIRPYAQLSREIGLDEKTIRDICNEEIASLLKNHAPQAPVALGIDELHLLGKKRTIFTNVGERRIIDMIDAMNRQPVDRWLYRLPNKERIKIVTMDMWGPYRAAVRAILPNAVIITDKWHIQSKANAVLDLIRNKQRRAAKVSARKNPWRARRLIHTSRTALSVRSRFMLDGMIANNPLLKDAWETKEAFYDIWGYEDRPSRAEAEKLFDAWKVSIPDSVSEFRAVAKTVEAWREEVFGYFDYPFTNAYTEAANGLIKIANRAGRGYRFDAIRARALTLPTRGKTVYLVCEHCLGQFSYERTEGGVYAGLHPNAPPGKDVIVCGRCRRFHIETWFKRHERST